MSKEWPQGFVGELAPRRLVNETPPAPETPEVKTEAPQPHQVKAGERFEPEPPTNIPRPAPEAGIRKVGKGKTKKAEAASPAPEIATPTPSPEPAPTPEPAQPEAAPSAPETPEPAPEAERQYEYKEVLVMQKEVFDARHEMRMVRGNKKVADLSKADQQAYKAKRDAYWQKRDAYLEALETLSEEDQEKLQALKKREDVEETLKRLENKYYGRTSKQIEMEALQGALATTQKEIEQIEERIKTLENYDKNTGRLVTAEGDTRELKARRRALLGRQKSLTDKLTLEASNEPTPLEPPRDLAGEARIQPEPVPQEAGPGNREAEPADMAFERSQAEIRAKRYNEIQERIIELDRQIEATKQELAQKSRMGQIFSFSLRMRLDDREFEKWQLEKELAGEPVGYGRKFAKDVQLAFKNFRDIGKRPKTQEEVVEQQIAEESQAQSPESVPGQGPASATPTVESAPAQGTWKGWIWERTKGLFTFGGLEYVQAHRFQKNTQEVAGSVGDSSELIEKERGPSPDEGLSLEDAQKEAFEINPGAARVDREGYGPRRMSKQRIEKASQEITARKVEYNDRLINNIIEKTIASLEERLAKYKGVSGQNVLTEEAKDKIANDLQQRLNEMRSSYIKADEAELAEMLRKDLEPDWWKRYMYGGIESALWVATAAGVSGYLVASKLVAAKAAGLTTKEAGYAVLKDTIWAEAKRQLVSHGVTHPTNVQIMKVATQFCKDSGVKVVTKGGEILWNQTSGGILRDIALKKGFHIVTGGGLKVISAIKAGAAGAAL